MTDEANIERDFMAKLVELKYDYREDIHDRAELEKTFRERFEAHKKRVIQLLISSPKVADA